MDEQLKNDAQLLCQKIRELSKKLDKKLEKIQTINPNFSSENIKIEIKEMEEKILIKPPAGKVNTKWDNTIIDWTGTLRRPW
tara:strand:+ start:247 stop:492 length:246 start_codon:yes stop_codon:yes gene_type:complete